MSRDDRSALYAFSTALLARMPFADAATTALPLPRLLRLGLFQVTVGMANALLVGALNRVMIVELGMAASIVSLAVALPMLLAPLRAAMGFASDTHRSAFGWRRVPYIWKGTMWQFFGYALMPFAMLAITGQGAMDMVSFGWAVLLLAFVMVGIGTNLTQTAGLALATDLATEETRPRVVALLWVMLLVGMVIGALGFGVALRDYSPTKLVQVVQGVGLLTLALNIVAVWRQEARDPARAATPPATQSFFAAWEEYRREPRAVRLLVVVGLGALGFNMQDVLLEPYGGQVLGLSVAGTTVLTAISASGALLAFGVAARWLRGLMDPARVAAAGVLTGLLAFCAVILASPLASPALFRLGALGIGFGGGLFSVGTLTLAMQQARTERAGLALGAWGAVQASCAGVGALVGGAVRDVMTSAHLLHGGAGPSPAASGYVAVYVLELVFLFVALAVLGPLATPLGARRAVVAEPFGLADLPG
ncbi:MAG: BCD family MFS transporter [Gemmatimonadales bacterium]|nr:BCD family MFS transporter [Gemmatimonadales bacterium]